jgi:transglutaminase-like putative cysteine protease
MKTDAVSATDLTPFLAASSVVDWTHPAVNTLARELARDGGALDDIVKRCFEWVRDEIQHSSDFKRGPVTCSASEVLQARTGFCYAKSHLLAALLRANAIPTAFCYQRLSMDGRGGPFCLHGLNAVHLGGIGWYRLDARGNRSGIDAQFCPPQERLAFGVSVEGEVNLPGVLAEPLPEVVSALQSHQSWEILSRNLPDISVADRKPD